MEDGGRWQGVTLARVAGIEETWSGKCRAYHINIYIYHLLAFLGNMFYLNPHRSGLEPAITAATARQRCADRGLGKSPQGSSLSSTGQLAVAPCARQGYCMASKTKAKAIAWHSCLIWSLEGFCPSQLAAASWVSQCHLAFFGCFECQLPEFPQRLSRQPLCRRRSFPSNIK